MQAGFNVNGNWEAERVVFFDIRIINADTPSYADKTGQLSQKHIKYARAAVDIRGSFTSLICSTEGVRHKEYAAFQKRTKNALLIRCVSPPIVNNEIVYLCMYLNLNI